MLMAGASVSWPMVKRLEAVLALPATSVNFPLLTLTSVVEVALPGVSLAV